MRTIRVLAPLLLAASLVAPAQAEEATWTGPLSTRGRWIVDAHGDRFKLKSGNWHGASGTYTGSGDIDDPATHHAGEKADQVPLGLDRATMATIISGFTEIGVNSVRLPFSNQMLKDTTPVTGLKDAHLNGKRPLEVYDAAVAELTRNGLAVILNNHTTTSRWCCGVDGNERWNTSQSTDQWINDWAFMANRYQDNKRVVGADLYNEARRTVWDDPNWGWGNDHDWHKASQQAADRIQQTAPDLLVIVEGINWTGIPVDGFAHGRPTLEPARFLSHTLANPDKLVYSAHFYGYTGPNHSGATGIGETSDPRYQDLSPQEHINVLQRQAFFITEAQKHFTAPLWISEFGVGGREESNPKARDWFERFVDHLLATDTDFAYWPLVGFHDNRRGNGWALLHWDANGNRMGDNDGDDWRASAWNRLVNAPGRTGQVPRETRWNQLTRESCPQNQKLIGISHTGNRGLCVSGPQWSGTTRVTTEQHVTTDWAAGYTKLQCPSGNAAVGYANLTLVCAPTAGGTSTRVLWFDRGDNRPDQGGDWANGHHKGQCAQDEHIAGVAYNWRRTPDAVLCRK